MEYFQYHMYFRDNNWNGGSSAILFMDTMELFSRTGLSLLFVSAAFAATASAIEDFCKSTVSFEGGNTNTLLASRGATVHIYADAADWPGVLRAVNDLALDFGRVTGTNGSLITTGKAARNAPTIFNVTGISEDWSVGVDRAASKAGNIIVGTIGHSSLIYAIIANGRLTISAIEGQWEAYVSAFVSNAGHRTGAALVIAGMLCTPSQNLSNQSWIGSDCRGTIYGIYEIAEQIGVSPWHWFADVPPKSHDSIYALQTIKIQKTPTVKYRGFFINDETPALTGWADDRYPLSPFGVPFGAEFYAQVFEVLLRLRENYLWTAEWNGMFNVDDPRNQLLADEFGIVMGTSHTEPMARATREWNKLANGTDSGWTWVTNNATLHKYFLEGVQRAAPYENGMTVGMRGYHDNAISADVQTGVLEALVNAQQQILT